MASHPKPVIPAGSFHKVALIFVQHLYFITKYDVFQLKTLSYKLRASKAIKVNSEIRALWQLGPHVVLRPAVMC